MRIERQSWAGLMIGLLVVAAGCAPQSAATAPSTTAPEPQPATPTPAPGLAYQPEPAEYRWDQRLKRDSIRPIYDPVFVPAVDSDYQADELVIGVDIEGQAKAYAIGPLNNREMVNDTLAGVPILVTW